MFTRLRAGDATAGADLVRLWGDQLYRTALAVVRSRDLAEDVVQDTLIKEITRAGGFRGRSDPGTWLHRICVNTAYDALRRERRRATFQGIGREPECPASHGYPTGLDETIDLRMAVDRLPPHLRVTLVLHYVEDMTVDQVAKITGVASGTVKARLHAARAALRNWLGEGVEDDG